MYCLLLPRVSIVFVLLFSIFMILRRAYWFSFELQINLFTDTSIYPTVIVGVDIKLLFLIEDLGTLSLCKTILIKALFSYHV